MTWIAVLSTIAQEGQAGSGSSFTPPNTTIATSASGNYNMAILMKIFTNHNGFFGSGYEADGSEYTQDGTKTSSGTVQINASNFSTLVGNNSGACQILAGGYARHSLSSPSYAWVNTIKSSSLSNSNSVQVSPVVSYLTTQDCTVYNTSASPSVLGIANGDQIPLTFGGGRGGIITPSAGDDFVFETKLTLNSSATEVFTVETTVEFV